MKTGLAFSGGKDSWACLWLNADRLAEMPVIWVNTGKNIPEVLATVEKARAMCPLFHEVKSDQAEQVREWGWPSDVVPVNFTRKGQSVKGKSIITVQSYLDCCLANISFPLYQKAVELGLEALIVGQRNVDSHRGARKSGDHIGTLQYLHPIEDWTDEQVLDFIGANMELPEHFALKHTSVDCYDCTAYRRETADKVAFLRARHPDLYAEYKDRADVLHYVLHQELN